jgi:uncharacterized membrane protein
MRMLIATIALQAALIATAIAVLIGIVHEWLEQRRIERG